jgi:hypothetical protein
VVVSLAAPLIIMTYPIPDVAGGWCQSGGRPGHYTVESVATVAVWSEVIAASAVVVLLASAFRSWGRRIAGGLAVGVIALAIVSVTYFIYAGRVDCAFS